MIGRRHAGITEGESLLSWAIREARLRRREDVWSLLVEAGVPRLSKPVACLRAGVPPATFAEMLGCGIADVERRSLMPGPDPFFCGLDGVTIRTADVLTHLRRFSPVTLGRDEVHRQTWMIRTLPFCPFSWQYLVDACGRCLTAQRWKRSINVLRCDRCGSDLSRTSAPLVDVGLRPMLDQVAALIDRTHPGHLDLISGLPGHLEDLDAGTVFEIVLSVARVVDPGLPLREPARTGPERQRALAEALTEGWRAVRESPGAVADVVSRRRGASNVRVRGLVDPDPRRGSLSGATLFFRKVLRSDAETVRVKAAARALGATEMQIARARDEDRLPAATVLRNGAVTHGLDAAEIELLSGWRRDRISRHRAAATLGVPAYGLRQLVDAHLMTERHHPWFDLHYGGPILLSSDVDALIDRILAASHARTEATMGLVGMMRGFGGGAKPWAEVFARMLARDFVFHAGRNPEGRLVIEAPAALRQRILGLDAARPMERYSQVDALEVLNLPPKHGHLLEPYRTAELDRKWSLDGRAVEAIAISRMSIGELTARFGLPHDELRRLLEARGCRRVDAFGFERRVVMAAASDLETSTKGT